MDRRYLIERDQFPLYAWWTEAHRLRDKAGGSLERESELHMIFKMLNAITYADNANPYFNPVPRHTEMVTLGNEQLEVRDATIYLHPCQRVMMNTSRLLDEEMEIKMSGDIPQSYCFSCPLKNPAPHLIVTMCGDSYEYRRTNGLCNQILLQVIDNVCRHCTLLDPDLKYKGGCP